MLTEMKPQNDLKELEKGITERLLTLIDKGEREKALELCRQLPKDFRNMYTMLQQSINLFYLPYVQRLFEGSQAALAERITKAVEDKDDDEARRLLEQKRQQWRAIHDTYIEILARLFGMIGQAFGDEALENAHRDLAEQIRAWYDKRESMSAGEQVRHCAYVYNEHLSEKIKIEEDEEKYTVTLDGCGGGGRLLRRGLYDKPSGALRKVSRPQVMTAGRAGYPVYCTHCQVLFGAFPMENYGNPLWVIDAPRKPEDPCRILIYKDRDKIPEKYRKRWRRS